MAYAVAMNVSILIACGDPRLARDLQALLATNERSIVHADRTVMAQERLRLGAAELVVIAGRLLDARAMQLLTQLRADPVTADLAVLVLGEEGDEVERMVALELGADEYLPSAANTRELVLRVNALLRRARPSPAPAGPRERYGLLEIDRAAFRAWVDGQPCELSAAEFRLLVALATPAGSAHHRAKLRDALDVGERTEGDRFIDARVARLRERLGLAGAQIATVRGVGYRLDTRSPVEGEAAAGA